MTQEERRTYLIRRLLSENIEYKGYEVPQEEAGQRQLLRGLMNVRMPADADDEFVRVQDEYLQKEQKAKGVVDVNTLKEVEPGICLWKGDITRLNVEAIVNAANSGMTGCYRPNHNCIDNCIHTFSGIQLRKECSDIMVAQGFEEPTGQAKITPGYNLPAKYVIHTVGPIVSGRLTKTHEAQLASCYNSCLKTAAENDLSSIAFCCISTGVFMFPNYRAAEIAVQTVREFLKKSTSVKKVIFNVFKEYDLEIYRELLG
ncbi:protein-ADP-ribose hydrolase [Pseudoramibacter alactolyticus]|jgi:O-acetyl-ADP-ribose deacetylase (regulator of RNase III)|uniref:protein-ADP-ribose hydrolase n=1 Tax=Pseudoramibacter alactolyticus TaxID=113287 RepID=UPI00248E6A59|nr:protein-ADP-ribose hydrolase [Pseudoramibacter alactolyticus]